MCKWLLYLNSSGREPNIQISYNLYRRTKNTFKISFATFWTFEFVTNVYNSTQSLIKSRWRVRGGTQPQNDGMCGEKFGIRIRTLTRQLSNAENASLQDIFHSESYPYKVIK